MANRGIIMLMSENIKEMPPEKVGGAAKIENIGYQKIFYPLIDSKQRLPGELGEIEPVEAPEGVDVFRVDDIEGVERPGIDSVTILGVSDMHHSSDPERIRQESLGSLYAAFRLADRMGYRASMAIKELQSLWEANAQLVTGIFKMALSGGDVEQMQSYIDRYDGEGISSESIKGIWNLGRIWAWEWRRAVEENREDALINDFEWQKEESRGIVDSWMRTGRWQMRTALNNAALQHFVAELDGVLDTDNFELLSMGDDAHDGGNAHDHANLQRKVFEMLEGMSYEGRVSVAKLWGNHDQDAREPALIDMLFKIYGAQIAYQEVGTAEGEEDRVLIASLDTFILSKEWKAVLEDSLSRLDDELRDHVVNDVELLQECQNKVLEKMTTYKGKVVIMAHHPKRLMRYFDENSIGFDNMTSDDIRVFGGHTHKTEEYVVVNGGKKVPVVTVNGFVKIGTHDVGGIDALKLVIKENGDVSHEIMHVSGQKLLEDIR